MSEVLYGFIEEFPGYKIGDDGSVWSQKPGCKRYLYSDGYWKRLSGKLTQKGYVSFCIRTLDGKARHVHGHSLVLTAFSGKRPSNLEARHLNGVGTDNRLVNLKWGTHKENTNDKVIHGTVIKGSQHGASVLKEHQAKAIPQLFALGYRQAQLASYFKVSRAVVNSVLTGDAWGHITGISTGTKVERRNFVPKTGKGESNPRAKLTADKVAEIFAAIASGQKHQSVAAHFNVSISNVWAISSGRTWKHLNLRAV